MAKFRTNDLQRIVNRFFFEDSSSIINYAFKCNPVDSQTAPTKENKAKAQFNRKNAEKLTKDLAWLNGRGKLRVSDLPTGQLKLVVLMHSPPGRLPTPRH